MAGCMGWTGEGGGRAGFDRLDEKKKEMDLKFEILFLN
jgi:hypothetical protein